MIKAICEDINKIARITAVKQLAKINKALKMDHAPGRNNELKRVPSDDVNFEIAPLDFEANIGQDWKLLNVITGGNQTMRNESGA